MKRDQKKTVRRLFRYVKPELKRMALALLCSVLAVAATLLIPVLVGDAVNVIDETAATGLDVGKLGNLLIALFVCIAVGALFSYFQSILSGSISYRITAAIRRDCLEKVITCELSYIDSIPHGDLIARVGVDTDAVGDGLLQGITQLFNGIVTILGTIGLMFWVDVYTALVVICITPVTLAVSSLIARYSHKVFAKQSKLRGEMGAVVAESFGNQKLVKAFGHEDESQARFDEVNLQIDKVGTKAQFASAIANPSTRVINAVLYAAVCTFGAVSILNGFSSMDVGALSSFLMYTNHFSRPFNEISTVAAELQSAKASASRVFELLDMNAEPETGTDVLKSVQGDVALSHVDFGYVPENLLLQDLSLSVKRGMRVAIVGPTGCGKSTLINLLMRFYDVNGGAISIDETPIKSITRRSLRTAYGMVLQETWLTDATIAENIAYGKPNATRKEVIAAAKAAHCNRFIMSLPDGYDTRVTDDANLSVGQKQLLCIARVMLLSPPMLILDEATSNIDTRTEQRIQRAFAALTTDKTSFVVAHRFATIMDADLILVMRDGNIVEQGTHEALLKLNGFYATLYNAQFR